jgi:hypothetical protein
MTETGYAPVNGLHPGLMDNIGGLQPEHLADVTLVQRAGWLASMVTEFLDTEVG